MKGFILIGQKSKQGLKDLRLLEALISTRKDLNARLITEDNYKTQEQDLYSKQPIIFLEESELCEPFMKLIIWKYDKYGIRYGWYGARAVISIDSSNCENISSFSKDYKDITESVLKIDGPTNMREVIISKLLDIFISPPVKSSEPYIFKMVINKRNIKQAAHEYAMMIFFKQGLDDFLEQL